MRLRRGPVIIVCLGLSLGTGLAWYANENRRANAGYDQWNGVSIPATGLVVNPKGENPGDPTRAEEDFRRLYPAMRSFIESKGRFPSPSELVGQSSGAGDRPITWDDLQNPDEELADGGTPLKPNVPSYTWSYNADRPNGTKKPTRPKAGERDAWIVADFYERRHQVVQRSGRSKTHWTGCQVVLWSDGKIERIKPKDRLVVPLAPGTVTYALPGQAGLPKGLKTMRESDEKDRFNDITYEG